MSKNKRKTAQEKLAILKEAETNGAVETARKDGISYPTFLDWKNKLNDRGEKALLGDTGISSADLKKLYLENARLKELVIEKELHIKTHN